MTEEHSTSRVVRRGAGPVPRPWREDLALIAPTLLLIFASILDFGAANYESGVFWAALQCAWAAIVCAHAAASGKILRVPALQLAAGGLFLALLAWASITVLPLGGLGPFVPAPAWRLVGSSGALSIDPAATLVEIVKLAGLGAMFCTGWLLAQDERRAERLVTVFLWFGAAYAFWALSAFIAAAPFVLGLKKAYHFDRLTGSFFSANSAGSLFGLLTTVAWLSALRFVRLHLQADSGRLSLTRTLTAALLRTALAGLFWVALLFTVSRAAMAATAACLIVVTTIEVIEELTRRRVGAGKIVGFTVPIVLAMLVLFAATVGQRFLARIPELGADSGVRAQIFDAYIAAARQTPVAGHGLGAFRTVNAALVDPDTFTALWNLGAAHNVYLQWRVEGGLVGAGLMAAVLACLLLDVALRRIGGRAGRTRAAMALTASALLLIHNTVDYSIQAPAIAALWALLLGLGASPVVSRAGAPGRPKSRAGTSGTRGRHLHEHQLQG